MVWQKFKNLMKSNDLFYSSEMFRYKNEMEYKSLTGGILSIGVIITVLIGFANMIILTMQREIIFSQKEVNKHSQPPIMNLKASPQNNFMMAFQLFGVNLTSPVSYFDYDLVEKIVEGGYLLSQRNIPLVPCTRQHWAQLPQVIAIFDSLGVNSWLCPEIGFNLKLYGKYSSPASSEYTFTIKSCVNSSKITCASPQQIAQFKKDQDNIFALSYYFINSIINQNSKDFITYYMQDSQYIMYGKQLGAQAYIYLSDFQISSDYSIWPFQSIETLTGSIMESWVSRAFQILPQTEAEGQAQTYAFIRINKSANSIKYNRQVQKISIVFSFIGGMISAVSAVLFVIKAYNGQAFQIEIASALFTDPPQSQQLKNNNFLSYMKFILQNIWKSTKCCKSSSSFLVIQKCLQEMDKQMDVKRLIQRIIFLEHCLTFLFEDYQLESILMKRPTSYQAIKKVRQRCLESQQGIQEDNSSPNNLINLAPIDSSSLAFDSKIRANPQQNSKEKNKGQKPHIRFEGNLGFDDDIPLENSQYHLKKKTFVKSKKQILSTLQINAKKGDRISEKIYIHLYQKGADAIEKQQ